jgi:hypothetical protein
MLTLAPERVYPPFQPSLLQRQGPDTINIQGPFGAPAFYPFWNCWSELAFRAKELIPTFREPFLRAWPGARTGVSCGAAVGMLSQR